MSLIFQALRRLASETEDAPLEGLAPRTETTLPAVQTRAAFWWLLAAVLGLATLQLTLKQDLPSRVMSALTDTLEPMDPSVIAANGLPVVAKLSKFQATISNPETEPQLKVVMAEPKRNHRVVAKAQPDTETGLVTNSNVTDRGLGNDKPSYPQEDRGVVTQPVVKESLAVSRPANSPFRGSGDFTKDVGRQSHEQLLVADTEHTTTLRPTRKIESRELQQTRSREKSLQISRLTADLTRAVQAGDQIETDRLLAELGSKAGADNNYVLNMRAFVALARGQYAEVEILLERVLARDETNVNAGLNMAVAESRTGRLQQARQRLDNMAIAYPHDDRIVALLRSLPPGR